MSAIACLYNTSKEPIPSEQISGIMDAFQKFPSDDVQVWYKNHIFLGCHAQWITTESIGEQLPYYDSERQLTITADAIIDNRKELFELLQVDQDRRKSMPDSQLILLAYCKWKQETPKYLIGDFAFIIWDEREETLFAARDFSGCRTLYYHHNHNQIAFSTIIEPLLSFLKNNKVINEQWLAEFLAIPSMIDVVDASLTVYKDIYQLPPSHSLTLRNGKLKLSRYCTLASKETIKYKTNQEYEEAFIEVFTRAVKDRLRTHLNVGSYLSGGLDSGAVVGFASRVLQKSENTLHTFSYHPPETFEDFTPKNAITDERELIKQTVEYNKGINSSFYDFDKINLLTEVDETLDIMEMPYKFFENSFWLKGVYEKAKEKDIGILLSGERGNLTISWGPQFEYYSLLLRTMKWIQLNKELRLYCNNTNIKMNRLLPFIVKKAFPKLSGITQNRHANQMPFFINQEFANATGVYDKLSQHGFNIFGSRKTNIYEAKQHHFKELFYWNATNTFGTKLSLHYKVWKRDPTNDLRVIRFCLALPEAQYVQNGMGRALIRRATKGILPDSIRLEQVSRGAQGVDWVHRMKSNWNEFIEELDELRQNDYIFNYIDKEAVMKAISVIKEGPKIELAFDYHYKIAIRSLILYKFLKRLERG